MERLRNEKNVILLLGSCRKYEPMPNVENPTCDSEAVAAALEQHGHKVLLLDLRQTCRRHTSHPKSGCASHSAKESSLCTIATAININIALREYKIELKSVISFAEVWFRQYKALKVLVPCLEALNHYHVNIHLGWFGSPASFCAKRVSSIERTKAFRHLSNELSSHGILPFDAKTIYLGF